MFYLMKDRQIKNTFETFAQAVVFKNYGDYLQDDKGYKYFSDGTGDGFRALKESNSFSMYHDHGIYGQKKISKNNLIANARWIYYSFGLNESLAYLNRVRENKVKIIKQRMSTTI